jgi:hypothetical protein
MNFDVRSVNDKIHSSYVCVFKFHSCRITVTIKSQKVAAHSARFLMRSVFHQNMESNSRCSSQGILSSDTV